MTDSDLPIVHQLSSSDVSMMKEMMTMFGDAFEDVDAYTGARPRSAYHASLLESDYFIALAAIKEGAVVGGIAAYELMKFERERSEIYIYDLAVAEAYRRQGIASAMIEKLRSVAAVRGAYVVFVQADLVDEAAIALYTKFGTREDVLHFDIPVPRTDRPR